MPWWPKFLIHFVHPLSGCSPCQPEIFEQKWCSGGACDDEAPWWCTAGRWSCLHHEKRQAKESCWRKGTVKWCIDTCVFSFEAKWLGLHNSTGTFHHAVDWPFVQPFMGRSGDNLQMIKNEHYKARSHWQHSVYNSCVLCDPEMSNILIDFCSLGSKTYCHS